MKILRKVIFIYIITSAFVLNTACKSSNDLSHSANGDPSMKVMTYNILLEPANARGYTWEERRDKVIRMITKYQAGLVCAQEDWLNQREYIARETGFGKIGVSKVDGTETGDRAFVSIFYSKERFEPLTSGHFWLSETPDTPSRAWEASSNRICNWARFRDKWTEKQFYVFNTHLDHKSGSSRVKSARLLKAKIQEIAGNDPVILSGDMNAHPQTEPISIFSSFLSDARMTSENPPQGPLGTHNRKDVNFEPVKPIDYIFLSKQFSVDQHITAGDSENGFYPSDHFPIVVTIKIN